MEDGGPEPLAGLQRRGVTLHCPATLDIGWDIRPERIAPGTILHPGCRIHGAETSIGPGCELGREQPLTLIDCQLGHQVSLAGGYAEGATFLDGASLGSGAHVRPGTLLEEQAGGAHVVGLKQTLLFPFVTLGSEINFCDCLLAGGTSRRRHSEVGSSFIHFNFTPHGDKATPSLFGDVPRGVFLDQPPIFLGGQGGVVGPCRVEFGCVLAAGAVLREDALEPDRLLTPPPPQGAAERPFVPGRYRGFRRIVRNNLLYLGNVRALRAVYRTARPGFMDDDPYRRACRHGALQRLETVLAERIARLDQLGEIAISAGADAAAAAEARDAVRSWAQGKAAWERGGGEEAETASRDCFLAALRSADPAGGWIRAIQSLDADARSAGTRWLQSIVDKTVGLWQAISP